MSLVTTATARIGHLINRAPVPMAPTSSSRIFTATGHAGNMEAQMRAMGQSGVLFSIIDKSATGCAAVDWHLYRRARSGRKEDRIEVTSHPALTVLNRPNPFYTRQELIESGQQHNDLTGETWWIVARSSGSTLPVELWVARPDKMKPITSPTDFIVGYLYTGPNGEEIPLRRDEVIFMRRPNPLDPFRGLGPVQSILVDVDSEHYSALWNRNFFLNGAPPGGIIEVDKRLSQDEFDELSSRWREQHQGVANAHRVAVLEQAHWVDVKYTQRDMQFAELTAVADEKIRQAFGFPKPMLGSVADVNRANAEAAEFVFSKWFLVPRLERIKGALNADFLPLYGSLADNLEFDYDSPVSEDEAAENAERDSQVKAVVALVGAGFDASAVLEWAEMPDLPYTRPVPPPVTGPPPGSGSPDGTGPDSSGSGAAVAETAAARLGRFLAQSPPGELAARLDMLRVLVGVADDNAAKALPW